MLLFLTHDLMLGSKVASLARSQGIQMKMVSSVDEARRLSLDHLISLVIVDLQHLPPATESDGDPEPTSSLSELASLSGTQETAPPMIAYAQHVKTDLLDAAHGVAGVQVMTRGQFDKKIRVILEGIA